MISDFLKQHGEYHDDKSFKDLTTIKMGGEIAHYVLPNSIDDLKEIVYYLKTNKIAFKMLGNGSNLICGNSRFEGVVISMKNIRNYELNNTELYCEAGVMIPFLANYLAKNGLSGLEFAGGIPGCLGGLIYMNAGAYKHEIADIIDEVYVLKDDEFIWMSKDECDFSYRHSIFQEHPHWIILAAKIKLSRKSSEEIFEIMNDRLERRRKTQPLDMPSAGSCFRNPENNFAWKLIDEIGYRGYKINDVMVSDKHSNFIVNCGEGNAQDYLSIAYNIIDKVKEKYDLKLIMEVEKFNC